MSILGKIIVYEDKDNIVGKLFCNMFDVLLRLIYEYLDFFFFVIKWYGF